MLSSSVLGGLIYDQLIADGARGSKVSTFPYAIATGIVNSIVGQTFTSIDTGLITGVGTGLGTGITGLDSSSMASLALNVIYEVSNRGVNAPGLMDAIMGPVASHLASAATLSLTDPIVYTGTGTIVIGSFSMTISEMQGNIKQALINDGANVNASNLNNFCLALATGIVTNIQASGTGTLVITGTGGPGFPGTNTVTGTIS
jgi:hypothetical protein